MRTALVLVVAACVLPRPAHAGRSFYGWLYGTEVMPERGVELQSWVQEENGKYTARTDETWLAWSALIGITDRLELGLPLELKWLDAPASGDPTSARVKSFTFQRYGIEARYRLVSPDPVDAPALVPLIRLAVKRDVTRRDEVRIEGDAVASYETGRLHALVDLGFSGDVAGSSHFELHPGAGIGVAVTSELRVGAEIYAELSLDSSESWATAGPDLSWSHGRFWLSAALGLGVYDVRVAPRVIWGIAF